MSRTDLSWSIYESPIGPLTLLGGEAGLARLDFPGKVALPPEGRKRPIPAVEAQLDAYFAGELRRFELRLDLRRGTRLQRAVWDELLELPYGETVSYGELAARLGPELFRTVVEPQRRARVVGAANGRNPVPIVVPCHRVIGADGSLTGYGGGLQRKQALLDLERGVLAGARPDPRTLAKQLAMI